MEAKRILLTDCEQARASEQRVLVVDDEESVARYAEASCRASGYLTATAYDGIQAIEKAREFKPRCIVMGAMMPNMNGFDAAVEILRFQPDCKFVFMSGWEGSHILMDDYKRRGHDFTIFVSKPFAMVDMIAALGQAGYPVVGDELFPFSEVVELVYSLAMKIEQPPNHWRSSSPPYIVRLVNAAKFNPVGVMNYLRSRTLREKKAAS